jgi:hypothetical protein
MNSAASISPARSPALAAQESSIVPAYSVDEVVFIE